MEHWKLSCDWSKFVDRSLRLVARAWIFLYSAEGIVTPLLLCASSMSLGASSDEGIGMWQSQSLPFHKAMNEVGSSDHIVISTWREQGELSSRLCFWKKHQLRYLLGESLLQDVSWLGVNSTTSKGWCKVHFVRFLFIWVARKFYEDVRCVSCMLNMMQNLFTLSPGFQKTPLVCYYSQEQSAFNIKAYSVSYRFSEHLFLLHHTNETSQKVRENKQKVTAHT